MALIFHKRSQFEATWQTATVGRCDKVKKSSVLCKWKRNAATTNESVIRPLWETIVECRRKTMSNFPVCYDLSLPTYRDIIKKWYMENCEYHTSWSWYDILCTAAIYIQTLFSFTMFTFSSKKTDSWSKWNDILFLQAIRWPLWWPRVIKLVWMRIKRYWAQKCNTCDLLLK